MTASASLDERTLAALQGFDAENATDPRTLLWNGQELPRQLALALRLESWLLRIEPAPNLALRLAVRSQHLARFRTPRSEYPEGRLGYLNWRKDQAKRQAELAGRILEEQGFDEELRAQVRQIHLKQGIKQNPDVQTMEDALCLDFLEHEFTPFIDSYPDAKVLDIIKKTWAKMSPRGRDWALTLPFTGRAHRLLEEALRSPN